MHGNSIITKEQARFRSYCKIMSIANANTHCIHWLAFQCLERIIKEVRSLWL